MTIELERTRYPEFRTMLNKYGVAHKNRDGLVCSRCHNKIIPDVAGVPDYTLFVNGYGAVIEVKAGLDRIQLSQISDDQREHLDWWTEKSRGCAWLAIFLGDGKVTSKKDDRKRLWLIMWPQWKQYEKVIKDNTSVTYAPTYSIGRFKNPDLTMDKYFKRDELVWIDGSWSIPPYHQFYFMYKLGEIYAETVQ